MVRLVDRRRANRDLDRSPPRDSAASWNRRNSQLRGSLFTTEQGFPKLIRAGGQLERDIRRLRSAARSVKKAGQPRFDQRDHSQVDLVPSSHACRKLLKQLLLCNSSRINLDRLPLSMGAEVAVWGAKDDRAVDFEQSLPVLIRLLHEAVLHFPDPRLRVSKGLLKCRIQHQAGSAVGPCLVRGLHPTGGFSREQEGKGCLAVGCPWTTMASIARPQAIGPSHIEVSSCLGEEVDTGERHAAREFSVAEWRAANELFKLRRQGFDERTKSGVHFMPPNQLGIQSACE